MKDCNEALLKLIKRINKNTGLSTGVEFNSSVDKRFPNFSEVIKKTLLTKEGTVNTKNILILRNAGVSVEVLTNTKELQITLNKGIYSITIPLNKGECDG